MLRAGFLQRDNYVALRRSVDLERLGMSRRVRHPIQIIRPLLLIVRNASRCAILGLLRAVLRFANLDHWC